MREPGSACLACGGATRLRYPSRGQLDVEVPPEEVRCTSGDLAIYGDIWACTACGMAYQTADGDPEDLHRAYSGVEDPEYLSEESQRRDEFRALLGLLEDRRRPPGRLLEVGSYAGLCLDEAAGRGWEPSGIEPSRWAVSHARDVLGVDIVQGTLADAPWEPGTFDAACTWDVLEHLTDPLGDLVRIHELLAPGAPVALTTVNIAGRSSRLLRGRWPWLMRMHLWYFTPASLQALLIRAGFTDVEVGTHPKRLRLGYVLRRAERYAGPLGRALRTGAERTGIGEKVVSIDLGDIVSATAIRPA